MQPINDRDPNALRADRGAGGVHVRRADRNDAHSIARLLGQLGYPTAAPAIPERLERLAAGGRSAAWVAVVDDAIVGLATAHVYSALNRARDVASLTLLVVDEAARRSGVGRALVGAVEEFAREADCERLTVTTHEDRAGAQAFYPSIGLPFTGRRYGKTL